ncbi:hypothetical protein ABHD89_001285 [Salinicoccus halitifaciens]|uniref:Uncharacterized protein n=1 Tax=Salinicoccus halitifaciens TaxID=1073415 RepID=A0ABV2E911_9STAP
MSATLRKENTWGLSIPPMLGGMIGFAPGDMINFE